MSTELDLDDLGRRMNGALEVLQQEFAGLRTGRASAAILDPIIVDAYGSQMPINQLGTVSVPESRLIGVQVWDKGLVTAVDKAIRNSGLGLNPLVEGQLLRIPIPELNEERRQELQKVAGKYAEQARVAVRNVRRDGMETLKQLERDKEMGKDDLKLFSDEVQEMTDGVIKGIDDSLATKERDIMQV